MAISVVNIDEVETILMEGKASLPSYKMNRNFVGIRNSGYTCAGEVASDRSIRSVFP